MCRKLCPLRCPWQANGKTAIGRGQNNGRDASYFKGTIRDVRLYASALKADQIKKAADATALPSMLSSQHRYLNPNPRPRPRRPRPPRHLSLWRTLPHRSLHRLPHQWLRGSRPGTPIQVSIHTESTDNPAQAAARIALAKALFGSAPATSSTSPAFQSKPMATTASASQSVVVARPATTGTDNYIGQNLGLRPIASPALPISASKQEQLSALLAKYMADQITPEEYHRQRAAILARP